MPTPVLRGALAAAVALLSLTASVVPAAPALAGASAVDAAHVVTGASPVPGSPDTRGRTPALPEPTGPHPVGTTTLHLVDDSRPDPWVAEAASRELMVTLWYPARASRGRRAPYMTAQESALLLKDQNLDRVPPDTLSRTRTNAFVDAPPRGRGRALPLVVLSPGFSVSRSSLTALAEELASRGYVVAGIDHTYEASGTTFPDGRTATCVACESEESPEFGEKTTKGRAADVSFVLDRLIGADPAWPAAGLIDPSRIGMAGHSIGGNSATWTMLTDRRVRAGVNMDGTFYMPIPGKGLTRPFLMLGAGRIHKPGGLDDTWDRDWRRMTGWKRWLTVEGADHGSFSDYPMLTEQLGVDVNGRFSGARGVEITNRYVNAFFDLHLRKRSRPLLDGPSRRYPEVRSWLGRPSW
ncbi:putative dienelactone hydrolase [Streptosporangium becharense]|uniref:Putative dienelactone hydrolase n=1 Tax=Streptosporangium becharense TaxID=1816182 RepID=A0A7W9IHG8_9ACTN|nr:alpha/beta hydrolase [Streptosporangium becharense]MBB2914737.1 putative dienelactone hydrolase [Streptosporangium becharense]MBB5820862.1 putative dienelactone hydrolase [Streptosporangium becharense]